MKRVLSLVLALVMVLGMIPTFAAEATGAELLLENGFITGKDGADLEAKLDVNAPLTREQLAALIAELRGEKEDASIFAQAPDYTDVDKINAAWALPYVAYAQVNGFLKGYPDGSFRPQGAVPQQQLAAVLLNALGYTVDTDAKYATAVADLAELGVTVAVGNLTRGQAFDAMWKAVSEVNVNGEEMTLGVKLGKLDPPAPVVTELAVGTVKADNLKEVIVTFNNELDEETVVAANFVVKKAGVTVASTPKLLADNKTVAVVITSELDNQAAYTLTLDKVADVAGSVLAETIVPFTAFDATLPTVLGVTFTGPKNFEIKFSEPVETIGTVAVKTGTSTLSVNTSAFSGLGTDVISVELFSTLVDGSTYNITVTEFEDFAGYKNVIKTIDAVYTKDVTPPTASIVKATQEYVVVEFNKPVSGLHHGLFSHTFSAWKASKLTATDVRSSSAVTSGTTFYVWFTGESSAVDRPIPAGNATLNILPKQTSPAAEIIDLWGNKFAEANLTFVVTADTTAPEVKEVKVTAEDKFTVEFTKNVSFAAANVEVLDKDGKAISGLTLSVSPATGAKKYTVTMAGADLAGETIVVNIKNVKDTTLLTNAMPAYSTTLLITDKTAPVVEKVTLDVVGTGDAQYVDLYVYFDEDMDSATTLVAGNYQIFVTATNTFTKLTNTPVFVNGNKTVRIKLTADQRTEAEKATARLFVDNVKDVAGNVIEEKLFTTAFASQDDVKAVITSVQATGSKTVVVKFDSELSVVQDGAFTISGKALAGTEVALVEGKTVVTLTTTTDLTGFTTGDVTNTLALDGTKVKNLFGKSSDNVAAEDIVDKIKPALATGDTAIQFVDGFIEVTFTEALSNANEQLYAQDFVIVRGTTTLVAGVDYSTSVSGNQIIIANGSGDELADGVYKVSSKEAITYIVDTPSTGNTGNKAVAFTTVKTVTLALATDLATLVAEAAELEETDYTVGSWGDLETALALADGTQALKITKIAAIEAAIAALVEA